MLSELFEAQRVQVIQYFTQKQRLEKSQKHENKFVYQYLLFLLSFPIKILTTSQIQNIWRGLTPMFGTTGQNYLTVQQLKLAPRPQATIDTDNTFALLFKYDLEFRTSTYSGVFTSYTHISKKNKNKKPVFSSYAHTSTSTRTYSMPHLRPVCIAICVLSISPVLFFLSKQYSNSSFLSFFNKYILDRNILKQH